MTWRKTFGHHPLMGFNDREDGSIGPVAYLLRPGDAGSNTAADHMETAELAVAHLPKKFTAWLARRGRWLSCSVGMTITGAIHHTVLRVPATAWTVAVESGGEIRDGTWVAEIDGDVLKGR